ncbi:MAG TPA: hypothetical protein VNR38_20325 [Ureibacillus sp.]|nr:hypothetical protein [Ureibacillus sp.]
MRDFIAAFLGCFTIVLIGLFFTGGNPWAIIILISLFLALFVTVFLKQEIRIENVEKKLEKLLNEAQDIEK